MIPLRALALSLCAALAGCAVEPEATLIVRGSASAPPGAPGASPQGVTDGAVDPSSLVIGVRALYVAKSADCSNPVLVADYGLPPAQIDLINNPVLFTGSPPDGSYSCVILVMADVITATPATSFGSCAAGTAYQHDVYRDDDEGWKDISGSAVTGHGTHDAPQVDAISLFLSRDPDLAGRARALSPNQVLTLGGDLVVPGQSTFYWDARGSLVSQDGYCEVRPGAPAFQ